MLILPKILFVSESCLLDRKSGAAHSARAMLQTLAEAGWEARSVTLNCCDGDADEPLAEFDSRLDPILSAGSLVDVEDRLVSHRIQVLSSTRSRAVRPWHMQQFIETASSFLSAFQPDVVLTYGSDYLRPVFIQAQRLGAHIVFYMAHPSQTKRDHNAFDLFDHIITPSQTMAGLCKDRLNLEASVVNDIVDIPFDGNLNLDVHRVATRNERYVTLINPSPDKGGLFFINIAAQAAVISPNVKFRVVESRFGRADWVRLGVANADLERIDWYPPTRNMAKVYEEAALLLVPSLDFEASGRVVAEALHSGLPVLGMRTGGIPEQLNGGGFLFDLPEALAQNHLKAPTHEDLHQWVQYVRVLMKDDGIYRNAVNLALIAAKTHRPDQRRAEALAVFQKFLNSPLLPALTSDELMRDAAKAMRAKMNKEREAANAKIEADDFLSIDEKEDTQYGKLLQMSLAQPAVREALNAVNDKHWTKARNILEQYLRMMPEDITALSLLAEVADRQELEGEARRLLERVVQLAPGFIKAQQRLVGLLREAGDAEAALTYSFALIERAPQQPRYLSLNAALLTAANRFEEAIAVYEAYFRQRPGHVHDWMQYGLALKTIGRQEDAVAAYRKAISLAPSHGAAWHALSNMKLAVFGDEDIALMREQLARSELTDDDRCNLHFTLGKAFEDRKDFSPSFEHYAEANRIRRSGSDYDVGNIEAYVEQAKAVFTKEFFAERLGYGNPAKDPVFVLGLHRAGSTLVEQILASHSAIEGTRELPHVFSIARYFGAPGARVERHGLNAALLGDLSAAEFAALGQRFLELSKADRHTERPLFVDKMPVNWMHVGLIHLMLPNAKIIDIRRKPMSAGFALFKMNFGRGVEHSYDQRDIARYYLAYTDLMSHFDGVLPGRVHHIQYEQLVEDTESEIRRLVDYCALPFEDSCLQYWKTDRAVQTPSSEQVRQPIYKSAVDQWKNYEHWLAEMSAEFEKKLSSNK